MNEAMTRFFRQMFLALCGLVIVVALLWGLSRALGPTDAQEQAVATMRAQPALEGRDAFGALWLLPYEIPQAERAAVLAEDIRRHARPDWTPREGNGLDSHRPSVAQGRFPQSEPTAEEMDRFCGGLQEDCLARVRADRDGYAVLLEEYRGLIDRAALLGRHDGLRHPPQPAAQGLGFMPPPYQLSKLTATRNAYDFLEGRHAEAFAGACRDIDAWRRIGADSDLLISRMVGVAYASGLHARLFMDMLAEVPRDFVLPPECARAFAPPSGKELSMCQAMQGEFLQMSEGLASAREEYVTNHWRRFTDTLLFSVEMRVADVAEVYAVHCGKPALRAIASDTSWREPGEVRDWKRFQCIGNVQGCILASVSLFDHGKYVARIQDGNARIRLIGVLLRLRADPTAVGPFRDRLRAEAGEIGDAWREVDVAADGALLRMRNRRNGEAEYWSVPLPPYFRAGADSGAAASSD